MLFGSFLICAAAALTSATATVDESSFAPEDIIEKDIAIIGGGASGTYAAVRLREDLDKSIVVIEKNDHLGGHVNTYFDPVSKTSIDYGVLAYLRYGNSTAFFERFNIPIKPYVQPVGVTDVFVNSDNGSNLTSYAPPAFPDVFTAIQKWVNLTAPYTDELLPGFFNFWEPDQIPSELLLPFGDFARQNGLEAMVPIMTVISNVGVGGVEDVLTLYVYFAFGQPVSQEFLLQDLFVPDGYSNSELYIRALQLLEDDVELTSQVTAAERTKDGVKLVVQGADGHCKCVKAKKLLFTPPPSTEILAPFDLDEKESTPLSTWTGAYSFVAIAKIPGIPVNTTLTFYSPEAVPNDYLAIRNMPFTLSLASAQLAGEDIFEILFDTDYPINYQDAQAMIMEGVRNMTAPGGVYEGEDSMVEFLEFHDHNSVLWRQSPDQLRSGIVQDIYSLQGYRSTWYTGGLWSEDYSGNVWAFTDELLPRMLAGM